MSDINYYEVHTVKQGWNGDAIDESIRANDESAIVRHRDLEEESGQTMYSIYVDGKRVGVARSEHEAMAYLREEQARHRSK